LVRAPTMRSYPQPVFSRAIRTTRASTSGATAGRPGYRRCLEPSTFLATSLRYHAKMVSGLATQPGSVRIIRQHQSTALNGFDEPARDLRTHCRAAPASPNPAFVSCDHVADIGSRMDYDGDAGSTWVGRRAVKPTCPLACRAPVCQCEAPQLRAGVYPKSTAGIQSWRVDRLPLLAIASVLPK
jgi:hypothetical protein